MTERANGAGPDIDPMIGSVKSHAQDLLGDTIALRRTLHEWPEIGNDLPITRERVLESLEGLPLVDHDPRVDQRHRRAARRGRSRARRCCCAATWTPCRCPRTPGSTSPRTSTAACTPAVTTRTRRCSSSAAHLLSERRDDIAGRVLFMFQPGEEGHHGARFMLDEGLLDVPARSDGTRVAGRLPRSPCTSPRRCRAAG